MKTRSRPLHGPRAGAPALAAAAALLALGCDQRTPEPKAVSEADNPYPAGAETPTFFSSAQWKKFEPREVAKH